MSDATPQAGRTAPPPALPRGTLDPRRPVHYDEETSAWHVYSYADVLRATTRTDEFTQDYMAQYHMHDRPWHPAYEAMWAADPPRHTELRSLVAEPFRRTVLDRWAPAVRAEVERALTAIRKQRSFDMMEDFARPMANRVICRIIGLPWGDDPRIGGWVQEQLAAGTADTLPAQQDMIAYFLDLVAKRKASGTDGTIFGDLIDAQRRGCTIADVALSDRDITGYVWGLLLGGEDTATSIGNTMIALSEGGFIAEVSEICRRGGESALVRALHEALRWNPVFPAEMVFTRRDLDFGAVRVPGGSTVIAWISAANRDPEHFADPDVFDIAREPNRHLSFMRGPHYCLGSPLAMLILRTSVETLVTGLPPTLRLQPETVHYQFGVVNSLRTARFIIAGEGA